MHFDWLKRIILHRLMLQMWRHVFFYLTFICSKTICLSNKKEIRIDLNFIFCRWDKKNVARQKKNTWGHT